MRERRMTSAGSIARVALLILVSTGMVAAPALAVGASGNAQAPADGGGSAVGTAELGASVLSVEQGETARFEVTLGDTRAATVVVGGPDRGYNVTVTVTDENGDGVVPLEFRTGSVGMEASRFVPAADGDDYRTLNGAPDPDGIVPAGEYPIAVYAGHGVAGEPTDVGTLVVNEQTAPPDASFDRAGSAITLTSEPRQAITGNTELAAGRNVTVRLRSSGESPFLMSETTSVAEDGTFTARFDLSGVQAPANATASVYADGERIAGPAEVEVVSARSSATDEPSEVTTTPGQPGFGVVAAAAALLGAIALGRFVRD